MDVSELSDALDSTDAPLAFLVLEWVAWVHCTREAIPQDVLPAVCLILAMPR